MSLRGFVKISAICNAVSQYRTETNLFLTNVLKWWYFSAMCLVRGLIFGVNTPLIVFVHCEMDNGGAWFELD